MRSNLYAEFIDFFKKQGLYDEEMFNYIRENSILFDYLEEERIGSIGCYYFNKNGKLDYIRLFVPVINCYEALLINIHVYISAILAYKSLGKKYQIGRDEEVLPMLYERIYLLENPNQKLEEYFELLNQNITDESDEKYQIGLNVSAELLDYYKNNAPTTRKLEKKAKRLSKREKK